MDFELPVQAVPGIVAVVVGCPDGCGESFPVPVARVATEPASQGMLTASVQITAAATTEALADHVALRH